MLPGYYVHCLECDAYHPLDREPSRSQELPDCEDCVAAGEDPGAVEAVLVEACPDSDGCDSDWHDYGRGVHIIELDL